MASESGTRLGKYVLQSRLGQGGMGIVYRATDQRLQRDVALKLLPPELARDDEAVRRFLREARAAARLNHPHVVAVYEVDRQEGNCFLAMELVTGGSVQDKLRTGPLPWPEATRMIADVCLGLAAAHDAELIHRDIKPSNLMLTADGQVKLADFGLAKITGDRQLTKANTIFGSPDFMSPEQCRGDALDGRSDVYSLGATYYTMLTGRLAYSAEEPLQVMFAHCSQPPPDPRASQPGLPEICAQIVAKAMAKNRADRFSSAPEMRAALQTALSDGPTAQLADATIAAPPIAARDNRSTLPPTLGETRRAPVPPPPPPDAPSIAPEAPHPSPISRPALAIGAAILLLLAVTLWWSWPYLQGEQTGRKTPSDPPQATQPVMPVAAQAPRLSLHGTFSKIDSPIRGAAFSPDETRLFAAGDQGKLQEWNFAARQPVREYQGATNALRAIAVSRSMLITGGDAKTLWRWKVSEPEVKESIADFTGEISAMAFCPDGTRLAVGTYSELRLYSVDGNGALRLLKTLGRSNEPPVQCYMVKSVAFSPDGKWLAATTWGEKGAAIWNASDGAWIAALREKYREPAAVTFLPNSTSIVLGGGREGICVWDWKQNTTRDFPDAAEANLRSLVILPESGVAMTVGQWGGEIDCYSIATGRRLRRVPADTSAAALGSLLTRDHKQFLSFGGDDNRGGYLQVWSIEAAAP